MKTIFIIVIVVNLFLMCNAESKSISEENGEFVGRMLEQGRTMVHHAFKRMMIILPAIFFKLGIAFTLLIIVTIAAINNGFIGFLLLVVGLSSVLARFQESRRPSASPYIAPLPPYYHHILQDRSDNNVMEKAPVDSSVAYQPYQYYAYNNKAYSG